MTLPIVRLPGINDKALPIEHLLTSPNMTLNEEPSIKKREFVYKESLILGISGLLVDIITNKARIIKGMERK